MIKNLTNNKTKYWYRYYKDTLKPYPLGYCFNSNGTFIRYVNPNWDRTRREIITNPSYPNAIWKFVDDSTIVLGANVNYKIITLTEERLILMRIDVLDGNISYLKLHKEKDQITKPSYSKSKNPDIFPEL